MSAPPRKRLMREDTDHWEDGLLAQHLPSTKLDSDSNEDTPTTSQTMTRDKPKLMLEDLMHYAHTEDTSFVLIVTDLPLNDC